MRRTTVLLLVLGMVALLAATSDARGRGAGRGPAMCGMGPCAAMGPMWADSSGMSKELMEKIAKERQTLMMETLSIRTQLFEKTERFQLMMGDSKAKDDDILKLQQEVHSLKGQLAQKHLQHMLRIRRDLPEGTRPGCCFMGEGCNMGLCGGMDRMGPGAMAGRHGGCGMGCMQGNGRGCSAGSGPRR